MNDIVFAISGGLAFTSILVVMMATIVLGRKAKKKQYDSIFWFAVALICAWFSTFFFRVLYMAGKYAWLDPDKTLSDGWYVPVMLTVVIISGIIHLKALTVRYNDYLWKVAAILVFILTVIFYGVS
jgi:hypothetical protein